MHNSIFSLKERNVFVCVFYIIMLLCNNIELLFHLFHISSYETMYVLNVSAASTSSFTKEYFLISFTIRIVWLSEKLILYYVLNKYVLHTSRFCYWMVAN